MDKSEVKFATEKKKVICSGGIVKDGLVTYATNVGTKPCITKIEFYDGSETVTFNRQF